MDKFTKEEETVLVPVMAIWDATNDVTRLAGISRLAAYLTSPQHLQEDDDYGIFHDLFMDITTRLDAASYALENARENPIIIKPEQVVKRA